MIRAPLVRDGWNGTARAALPPRRECGTTRGHDWTLNPLEVPRFPKNSLWNLCESYAEEGCPMADAPIWHFGDYRLDLPNACRWRGTQALHLTPKACTVLSTLVQHAGQLVTKDALLQAAWPETAVREAVLTLCISELRKVLGETAQAPRYIATVHRRG